MMKRNFNNDNNLNEIMEQRYIELDENTAKRQRLAKLEDTYNNPLIYSVGNEIHFSTGINKFTIEYAIRLITEIIHNEKDDYKKYKEGDKKLQITYIVDSPGGCVSTILKFYDFVRRVKNKYNYVEFISIITGTAASAGTIMATIAHKRQMTLHAHAMIHELATGMSGSYTKIMSYGDHLTKIHNELADVYMEKCKTKRKRILKLLKNETWLNAEEYLKLGLIDEII
jgi:ATP-dependent protease ClpP protease subunit